MAVTNEKHLSTFLNGKCLKNPMCKRFAWSCICIEFRTILKSSKFWSLLMLQYDHIIMTKSIKLFANFFINNRHSVLFKLVRTIRTHYMHYYSNIQSFHIPFLVPIQYHTLVITFNVYISQCLIIFMALHQGEMMMMIILMERFDFNYYQKLWHH